MNDESGNDLELISKSQRKREADAMQELGRKLTALRPAQRALLPLTETLLSAVEEYNRLPNSFPARNRQLQFIGRVMRESDHEAIAEELTKLESPHYVSSKTKRRRLVEQNATQLLTEGDSAINQLLDKYPSLDRQQLRQLHREYQKCNETKRNALISRTVDLLRSAIKEEQD